MARSPARGARGVRRPASGLLGAKLPRSQPLRLDPEAFGARLVDRVDRRLRENHGRQKGRVLYVLGDPAPTIIAALAYHVPRDERYPLVVLGAGAAEWVEDQRPGATPLFLTLLLQALEAVSEAMDRGRDLAWVTDDDGLAQALFEDLHFAGRPSWAHPKGVREKHYMVREHRDN